MKQYFILFFLLSMSLGVFAQSKHGHNGSGQGNKTTADSLKSKADTGATGGAMHDKLLMEADTLTSSDFMLSIQRVNDNLNEIRDSIKLDFDLSSMGQRNSAITKDITTIRQNIRDKHSVIRIKNLYLYQNFATNLDEEVDRYQVHVEAEYNTVYRAKLHLKKVLTDSVFRRLYADSSLRKTYDKKLIRLERKWAKTDSTAKATIDSLNALKVKVADNAISLTNMLKIIETKLDKAGQQLFGKEVNFLWEQAPAIVQVKDTSSKTQSLWTNESKAIGYYFNQTSQQRGVVFVFGMLLIVWLFVKRKLLKTIRRKKDSFEFLHLHYLNKSPILALLVIMFCLMPFFDAYAPTAYLSIEYFVLLLASSFIIFRNKEHFRFDFLILAVLSIAIALTFLQIEPTLLARIWLLLLHAAVIVFSLRFYKKLSIQTPYFKLIRSAVVIGILLAGCGILCNLFGRFSLSNIVGLASIFAVTQAVILPIFIESILEIILVQLLSSRLKKGVEKPFNSSIVVNKIKGPLLILALIVWGIMLASNLNLFHSISNSLVEMMTMQRSLGSISFRLVNVLFFFVIIWFAHILQQLISFLFGEIGTEAEDMTSATKGQHSRLLITRLLVLIGGYLLAIAASGLPLDKLTFLLGALGIGIGMGLQNMVNNFVSGIILIFDGSLKIGDEIDVCGQNGKVTEIGLRASTIHTSDGAEVIIPNGNILSENIVNWTLSNDQRCVTLHFSLAGKDLDANMINEVINATIKTVPHVISKRKPVILYTKVKQETYSLTVRFWCNLHKADDVKSDATLHLNEAFTAKHIGFTFNSFTAEEIFVNVK